MFLEPLVFSRFSYEETQEKQIEKLIFIRQFHTAYKNIIEIAQKYKEQNRYVHRRIFNITIGGWDRLDKALRILKLCKERNVFVSAKSGDAKSRFKKELNDYSYFIPPNFSYVKVCFQHKVPG